jgi:hypothetical protein
MYCISFNVLYDADPDLDGISVSITTRASIDASGINARKPVRTGEFIVPMTLKLAEDNPLRDLNTSFGVPILLTQSFYFRVIVSDLTWCKCWRTIREMASDCAMPDVLADYLLAASPHLPHPQPHPPRTRTGTLAALCSPSLSLLPRRARQSPEQRCCTLAKVFVFTLRTIREDSEDAAR